MKKAVTILLTLFLATTIFAHEYVLIAYNFIVKEGEKLELHLFVADGFNIELEREGDWFFHSTLMIESPDLNNTDWKSFWTTFSFGLAETE